MQPIREIRIEEIRVAAAGAGPYGITVGSDGATWLTQVHAGVISRLGFDGDVTHHQLDDPGAGPSIITAGPDGALWFSTCPRRPPSPTA